MPTDLVTYAAEGAPVELDDFRHVVLSAVLDQHCLLEFRFERGAEAYQTAIVELVPELGYLVLDALKPADGNDLIAHSPGFRVRTRVDGLQLRFASRIVQQGSENGLPYYKALYPQVVDYPQRRREYRVTVPLSKGVQVEVTTTDGLRLVGEMRDLSPSGFSARLVRGDLAQLRGDTNDTAHCVMHLPGEGKVEAEIAICHVYRKPTGAAPRVGARFIDLDARAERQLERAVAQLDRERLRLR